MPEMKQAVRRAGGALVLMGVVSVLCAHAYAGGKEPNYVSDSDLMKHLVREGTRLIEKEKATAIRDLQEQLKRKQCKL